MNQQQLINLIKQHALKNYNKGWDFVIECNTDDDLAEELEAYGIKSLRAWVEHTQPVVDYRNDVIATGEW